MDFIRVAYKEKNDGTREYYPSLQAIESQDLVIRGGQFIAIWDEPTGLYSRRQSHLPVIVDRAFAEMVGDRLRPGDIVKKMQVFDNQMFSKFLALVRSIGDMGPELDQKLVFADQRPTKEDAATFVMPYSLSTSEHPAWDELTNTLYDEEERIKIEYMIGSIFTGAAARTLQKFYVFFGPPGTGKSTIMDVIEKLFEGHTASFSAYDMGKADAQFSLEPFAKNPMVAMDPDGDLSRLELNKNLNAVVSHDRVLINSKGRNLYAITPRTCLIIGSNEPVKISNRKSGLFRRLVDIQPSGRLLDEEHYHNIISQVGFELGAIATRCIKVFETLGPTYLSSYRSTDMMYRTNDIFNFVQDNRLLLMHGVTLKQAAKMYADWCVETDTRNVYKQYQFRDLMMDYFKEFHAEIMIDGQRHRSWFAELRELEKFSWKGLAPTPPKNWLELIDQPSILDELLQDEKAQYTQDNERYPLGKPWDAVVDTLADLDTSREHHVKVPHQHIVIDFDLKDENGHKSLERNLEAAAKWPVTYAEVSRGGGGLHLHYDFAGDVTRLADRGVDGSYEIKTLLGGASLRRKLRLCNNLPVAELSSGLPFKEEKVLSSKTVATEKTLRKQILQGLNKEVHAYTKPSMDFIKMVTDEAYKQGLVFDVSDMYDDIFQFAMSSQNQRAICLEILQELKLKSEEEVESVTEDKPHIILDIEVYPNLVAVGWMYADGPDDGPVVKLINPTPAEIEELLERLAYSAYNGRTYDNHILWAITLGYSTQKIYELSQRIISGDRSALFGPAYNLHYSDPYEYMSEKKTLKWWQIHYGLPHMEMDLPWDEPVPEDRLEDVYRYLENDVRSLKVVIRNREADFRARQIIAELAGMEVSNTNRQIAERIIFGKLPWDAQPDLVYTDLSEMFPGYVFDQFAPAKEKSTYRGVSVGEGGWVDAEKGIWENVLLLDVTSMHPTSIIELNLFGSDTQNFKDLLDTRVLIKKGDLESAGKLFDGRLKPYLGDESKAKELSDALKIVINSVYGLTAASFPNKFKDPRNNDNIVAKRGALFMVDLKEYVNGIADEMNIEMTVVHIKTDSIKISIKDPQYNGLVTTLVSEFGASYGYNFEHEATYDKFCLVNDAVYIARYGWHEKAHKIGTWDATGAQFQHPIVLKTLFTKEPFDAKDYVETKQVLKGAMYLVSPGPDGHRQFIGRFGAFVPVLGGRQLLRVDGDKEAAVTGTKDHLWEIDAIAEMDNLEVDYEYFQKLINAAAANIAKYGDFEAFVS